MRDFSKYEFIPYIWVGRDILYVRVFNLIGGILALTKCEVFGEDSKRRQFIWDDLLNVHLFHVKFRRDHERAHHVLLVILGTRGLLFLNLFLLGLDLLYLDNDFRGLKEIEKLVAKIGNLLHSMR